MAGDSVSIGETTMAIAIEAFHTHWGPASGRPQHAPAGRDLPSPPRRQSTSHETYRATTPRLSRAPSPVEPSAPARRGRRMTSSPARETSPLDLSPQRRRSSSPEIPVVMADSPRSSGPSDSDLLPQDRSDEGEDEDTQENISPRTRRL